MTKKKNRFVGRTLREYVAEQKARDTAFAAEWDNRQLARRIRTLREARGLTQADLAARIGTTQSAIARLESGRTTPTLEILQKIASSMGMRVTVGFSRVEAGID